MNELFTVFHTQFHTYTVTHTNNNILRILLYMRASKTSASIMMLDVRAPHCTNSLRTDWTLTDVASQASIRNSRINYLDVRAPQFASF